MQSLESLRAEHALPGLVDFQPGHGGLPKVVVATPLASAEVYLHGAHVTHYQPAGQPPVLFMSGASKFEPGKAIRGGVPICFPWFGPLEGHPKAPAHGFARITAWTLNSATRAADDTVTLTLEFARDEDPGSDWPHAFRAVYVVTVGRELTTALTVHHVHGEPFLFEAALHSYFVVGDVKQVSIAGLEHTPYLDKTKAGAEQPGVDAPIRFTGETDRVYLDTTAPCVATDPAMGRTITVTKSGSDSTVVWNPWIAKAKAMADFGDDEWPGMLCIETANVGRSAVTLAAGQSHTMSATVRAAAK
jgi:D-hexose-6-phosphate mutarotase